MAIKSTPLYNVAFFLVKVHNIYKSIIKLTEKPKYVTRPYIFPIIELQINYKICFKEAA